MEQEINILNLQVDAKQAVQSMTALEQELKKLQEEQAKIEEATNKTAKELKNTDEEYVKNAEKIKILNQRMAAHRKAVQNQIKAHEDNGRSLVAMRAQLSNLVQQFDNLSQKQREGELGHKLAKDIADLTKEIKGAEYATERYFRNVGNYPGKLDEAFKKVEEGFGDMGNAAQGFGSKCNGPFQSAVQGVKSMNTAMKVLYANPLIALIGVLAAILIGIANAISKNEEYVNRLRVAMAPLNLVMDAFANILSKAANVLVSVIETLTSGAAAILDFVGATNGASAAVAEYNKQIKEEIALEQERRKQVVSNAKGELEVAKMKDALAKTDKKNFKSRREQLQAIIAKEKEMAKTDVELAKREYELALAQSNNADNTAEDNARLAELEAKKYRAEKAYFDKVTSLDAQITELDNKEIESKKATAKAAEEAAKKKAEAKRKELEAAKKAADEAAKQRQKEIDDAKAAETKRFNEELSEQKRANDSALAEQDRQQRLRIAQLKQNGATQEQLETEQAKIQSERLGLEAAQLQSMYDELQQGRFESDLEYAQRKAELESKIAENEVRTAELATEQYLKVQKQKADADLKIEQAKTDAKTALQNAYNEMMSTSLGKSRAMATAQKAIATAEVAMNAGKAISEAVASATAGDPYTIALRIGAAVASVTAAIASAYDTIAGASFAKGGYVGGGRVMGAGSGTSDSIRANLSNGEYVVRASSVNDSTLPLLNALNYGNATGASQSVSNGDYIAKQMIMALQAQKAPVVSVVDINKGQERVSVVQSASKI